MTRHFALTVHLHGERYHGAGEWPPAPARVFQALVAGAAQGRRVPEEAARALRRLEGLAPPLIAAPLARRGQRVPLFVPNNDLDAVDGDPDRVGEIRTKKIVQAHLLESDPKFVYAWPLVDDDGDDLIPLAATLYQLGRGVDAAWAIGEVLDDDQLAARLRGHRGTIHHPTTGDDSYELAVPTTNSFDSLVRRFDAALARLRASGAGWTSFVQAPKPRFAMARYDGTPAFHLFEVRSESRPAMSSPWPSWRAAALVEHVRDTAVAALSGALPDRKADIERVLVGRRPDGAYAGPKSQRVRIIPLPSIGHRHADHAIRRVLVQVPPGPLAVGDVIWALTGRQLVDRSTGHATDSVLAAAVSDDMVVRYRGWSRTWTTVTPAALGSAPRRRIDPMRQREDAKAAAERAAEDRSAQHEVARALRQAGIGARLVHVRVQREPFDGHGTRAERFAGDTRFPKEALWHVELELDRAVRGPLVVGDGRFLGLGVMAPKIERGVFVVDVEGGIAADVRVDRLARALRRAVMARVQATLAARGEDELPAYFHGHATDGEPMRARRSSHLAFAVDAPRSRLLIVPPHVLDRRTRPFREEATHLETLDRALHGFTVLRAGRAGALSIDVSAISASDPLLHSSRVFRSVSDYVVTRHPKRSFAEDAVVMDVEQECARRGLPSPAEIHVASVRGVARVGVVARIEVRFAVALPGPILIGRSRYLGGGLLEPVAAGRAS